MGVMIESNINEGESLGNFAIYRKLFILTCARQPEGSRGGQGRSQIRCQYHGCLHQLGGHDHNARDSGTGCQGPPQARRRQRRLSCRSLEGWVRRTWRRGRWSWSSPDVSTMSPGPGIGTASCRNRSRISFRGLEFIRVLIFGIDKSIKHGMMTEGTFNKRRRLRCAPCLTEQERMEAIKSIE